MRVLLTGASGFLGRNFLLRAPEGWNILALYRNDASFPAFVQDLERRNIVAAQCDLESPGEIAAILDRHGRDWDAALYLAAKVDIPWSVEQPREDLLQNVSPLLNLLERVHVDNFVYFSSGAVYDGLSGEVRPDMPVAPTLPYAISKLACERYVDFYTRRRRSIGRHLIVRFFGAYGPYEAPHKIYTRLIRAFAIEGKDSYTLYGDGQNRIDAMYVDDAVDAILRMINGQCWNTTVNLAGGHPVTVETLARQIAHLIAPAGVRIEKQGAAHENNHFWGSTSEMQELFGFKARIGLAAGIARFSEFLGARAKENV